MVSMSNPKAQLNHRRYLEALSRMTPEQKLLKAMELSDLGRQACREGLRRSHPELSAAELHRLYLEVLRRCHNSNY